MRLPSQRADLCIHAPRKAGTGSARYASVAHCEAPTGKAMLPRCRDRRPGSVHLEPVGSAHPNSSHTFFPIHQLLQCTHPSSFTAPLLIVAQSSLTATPPPSLHCSSVAYAPQIATLHSPHLYRRPRCHSERFRACRKQANFGSILATRCGCARLGR